MIFINPNYQNPTGTVMAQERRSRCLMLQVNSGSPSWRMTLQFNRLRMSAACPFEIRRFRRVGAVHRVTFENRHPASE